MPGFVRIWHGVTRRDVADEYERFLVERAVPDYKSVPGLRKVIFTRRNEGDVTHFLHNDMGFDGGHGTVHRRGPLESQVLPGRRPVPTRKMRKSTNIQNILRIVKLMPPKH